MVYPTNILDISIYSLLPNVVIRHHRSGATLVQVMAGHLLYIRGPFPELFFHRNSNSMNSMKMSLCSHPRYSKMIAIKFCTWYNSYAAVTCAKCGSDIIPEGGVTLKQMFHIIWNLEFDGKVVRELCPRPLSETDRSRFLLWSDKIAAN